MIKMKLFERIFDIVEKHGPVPFSTILKEINGLHDDGVEEGEEPFGIAEIKSLIERKKDLFSVSGDVVFIEEEKNILSLTVRIWDDSDPSYSIHVDFLKNNFTVFEFSITTWKRRGNKERIVFPGSVEQFKKDIYRLHIWNWEKEYQPEELMIEGTSWYVSLNTKGKVYESNGFQSFPKEWNQFRRALSKLIGTRIP